MFNTTCARCQASLEVAKFLALAAPEEGPTLAVMLCEYFKYSTSCENYGPLVLGPIFTQVLYFADVGGYDGQVGRFVWSGIALCLNMLLSPFVLNFSVSVQHLLPCLLT